VTIALVGVGQWGRRLLDALCAHPALEVRWACDLDAERLATLRTQRSSWSGAQEPKVTTRLSDLLEDEQLEAVVVAVAPSKNGEIGLQVVQSGKHVLIEKPFATDLAVARRLVAEGERCGSVVGVGHILRYQAAFRAVDAHLAAAELGAPLAVFAERLGPHRRRELSPWWVLAPHDLSLLAHWFGTARHVVQQGSELVDATLSFSGGRFARLLLGGATERRRRTLLLAEHGLIRVDEHPDGARLGVCRFDAQGKTRARERWRSRFAAPLDELRGAVEEALAQSAFQACPVEAGDALAAEFTAFADAIRSGAPLVTSAAASLPVIEMLVAGEPTDPSGVVSVLPARSEDAHMPVYESHGLV
jgi:predicted dehydrogenase